ncbi:unnamed protein product [Fusarium equiseti]|uniref:Uncharacterized protein n=1 Tax=Fusarium equiseti TaxID=61235 RepID=A0A8J2IQI7_FUSEQ|nr:unnamed protein product [Fusarium equiseti]
MSPFVQRLYVAVSKKRELQFGSDSITELMLVPSSELTRTVLHSIAIVEDVGVKVTKKDDLRRRYDEQSMPEAQQNISAKSLNRGVSSSDDEPGPSVKRKTVKYKGKEPEVYGGSEALASIATRLIQMEGKLDELLSRERQPYHDEKTEAATDEQIQSSQIYQDLRVENERLEGELDTARMKLAGSKQVQNEMQSFLQDLEAAKERSENEAQERRAQAMNEYETLKIEYRSAKTNWDRTAEESIKAWDKAKEYEREHAALKQKISDLEDTNKELAGKIQVYDLENIRRKGSQSDGESQTEPEVEKEVETDVEPNSMESRGAEISFIDCDPNAKEEMELYGQGELESTEIQDGEQVEQDNRQEDQQQWLQDALQHDQHEVLQDKPDVRPEEPQEARQEDTQQDVTEERLEAEPHIQQTGEQEESQKELCDIQDEGQQDGATNKLEVEQEESEENISHSEMSARVEGQLERLMSTTQEPGIGGHTEPDNIEQQEMVETSVGNRQPTFEARAGQSPSETPEVVPVTFHVTLSREIPVAAGEVSLPQTVTTHVADHQKGYNIHIKM